LKTWCLLGQSNYAAAIILDCLQALFPHEPLAAHIVANIPADQNDSLAYPFDVPGVAVSEYFHSDWTPGVYEGYFVGSIGKSRRALVQFFMETYGIDPANYAVLIHPSAVCAPTVGLGAGVHIGPLSVVAPHAKLGNFAVVNRNASVGHHTILEDFTTLNPGVNVAGCCRIGAGVTLGAGATVLDKVAIGPGSIIGAGSVVTKDIPAGVVAYGVPAKVVREAPGT